MLVKSDKQMQYERPLPDGELFASRSESNREVTVLGECPSILTTFDVVG